MGRVLVVDDEQGLRDALEVLITSKGHVPTTAKSVAEAKDHLSRSFFDVVLTDLRLEPGGDGMDVVAAARAVEDPPEVIVMTAYGTREKAQLAISKGASFYLEKGPHLATDVQVLVAQAINTRRLQADNAQLRQALVGRFSVGGIVGRSEAMREVLDLVQRVGPLKTTVLITGESGTGKERVAKALHYAGETKGPFVPINCGAVPENLIESELFGHMKGAFTGADRDKEGLFEAARGGTLFLDEIGELPVQLQPKLLRALQERRIKRLGAVEEVPVEVRLVAATNRELEAEVRAGRFREDLYFRLNVVQIDLPSLRQRREDIPLLVSAFLRQFSEEYGREVLQVEPEAMERLLAFEYPGNVRQLQNIIERGVALAVGDTLRTTNLPKEVAHAESAPRRVISVQDDSAFPEEGVDLERLVEDFEYGLIARALEKAGGVKTRAAELLGLSFRQFRYKLSKFERRRDGGARG
ncbi:MAG: sigma-54-dependent Fis family transcriptional regulator [Myxococcales bacterium]|nr:sigma-54-dependent Fis family transcriptional regulator [Myxococcales bacterium]MCB9646852.1 sigma-54-dependent Fis family transcriptional regulator [Deltaproteobacteria bacterium]